MVADHVFRERLDVLVAGLGQRLLGSRDIDHACGIGDMSDLRIGELGACRKRRAAQKHHGGDRRTPSNKHL